MRGWMIWAILITAVFGIFQIMDLVSTYHLVSIYGIEGEMNEIVVWMYGMWGFFPVVLLKLVCIVVPVFVILYVKTNKWLFENKKWERNLKVAFAALGIETVMYAFVVANNFSILFMVPVGT